MSSATATTAICAATANGDGTNTIEELLPYDKAKDLAHMLARVLHVRPNEWEDAISESLKGYVTALSRLDRRFQLLQQTKFIRIRMRKAIVDYKRQYRPGGLHGIQRPRDWARLVFPQSVELHVSLSQCDPNPRPDEITQQHQDAAVALNSLRPRLRTIIEEYYWDQLTIAEIARVHQCSESTICRLHKEALEKMRRVLTKHERWA